MRFRKETHVFKSQEWSDACGAANEHAEGGVCGRLPERHRVRVRAPRTRAEKKRHQVRRKEKNALPDKFIGLDGEGQGKSPHRYVLLAASDEQGVRKFAVRNRRGLSTVECLEFILSLPVQRTKLFSYCFGYDITKILEDLDDMSLYKLLRPKLREKVIPGQKMPLRMPVFYPASGAAPLYALNYFNGQLSVKRVLGYKFGPPKPGEAPRFKFGPMSVVHDIWRFFQGKFVTALLDWKIGDAAMLRAMAEMKAKRGHFDRLSFEEIEEYCFEECTSMAQLARKLVDAHEAVGLKLKNFYGAGSSASAMLKVMGIDKHIQTARKLNPPPPAMAEAVASGFFGGWFENGELGEVEGPLESADISSAYPYQLCFLPCLLHGSWSLTTDREEAFRARTCLVRYELPEPALKRPWGPFPFREVNGCISHPSSSDGGWIWRDEYLAGEKLFPNVVFKEAWMYTCVCDCKPFKMIPDFYRQRVLIGKEGRGIVLKLGVNSCYGKTAQSVGGEGQFTSWIWAGLITSGCRAQCWEAAATLSSLDSLVMVATDSITSKERMALPEPKDTGTWDVANEKGELKPLGGWEYKTYEKGLFLARPGIFFAPDPTPEELKYVRARGIGRSSIVEYWDRIMAAFLMGEQVVKVQDLSRFIGAKTSISRSGVSPHYKYKRKLDYGTWIKRPVVMSFNPMPKRELQADGSLGLRSNTSLFPLNANKEGVGQGGMSTPYRAGLLSKEAVLLKMLAEEQAEQPDGDYSDYEDE